MSNSLWLTELRKEIEMAKTSGGVRGRDRIRSGVDAKKAMHRLIRTYGNANRDRIYKATRTVMDNLSRNTGYPVEVLMLNPTLSGSTLKRRRKR